MIRFVPFRGALKKFPCVNYYEYPYNNTFPARVSKPAVHSAEWFKLIQRKGRID